MERTTQRYILYGLITVLTIAFFSYAYSANQMNHRLAEINAEQVSECTILTCNTALFGGIVCRQRPVPDSFKPVPEPLTPGNGGG